MAAALAVPGFLLATAATSTAQAASEWLDPSFGTKGVAIISAPNLRAGTASGLAEDGKGRILASAVGPSEAFVLVRCRPDGSLDKGGSVKTVMRGESQAHAVAVQRDGKSVVAGSSQSSTGRLTLVRYDPDGSRDRSFGADGRVLTPLGVHPASVQAIAVQPDGRILAGGFRGGLREPVAVLTRYLPDGRLDRSFADDGILSIPGRPGSRTQISDMHLLGGGEILFAGGRSGQFMLGRVLGDGRLDSSFGDRGLVLIDVDGDRCVDVGCSFASSLAINHGRILVAGNGADPAGSFAAVARYRMDGGVDRRFGAAGIVKIRRGTGISAEDMVVRPNGQVVGVGYQESKKQPRLLSIFRLLADGRLDPNFGHQGVYLPQLGGASAAYSALLQRDGRVVVGGSVRTKVALLRLR